MKNSNTIKVVFVLCIGVLLAFGVQAVQDDTKATDKDIKPQSMQQTMQGCMAGMMQTCDKSVVDLAKAMKALDQANIDLDAGNIAAAKTQIKTAQTLLKGTNEAQIKCIGKMPACNTMCPMTGEKVDMTKTSGYQSAIYQGQKVGFSNQDSLSKWNKLSDTEKDTRLAKVANNQISDTQDTMKNNRDSVNDPNKMRDTDDVTKTNSEPVK